MSGDPNPFLLPGARPGIPRETDPEPGEQPRLGSPHPSAPAFPFASPPSPSPEVHSQTRRVPRAERADVQEATVLRPDAGVAAPDTAEADAPSDAAAEPAVAPRWRLVLPDGAEIPLDQPLLLGRDPSPPEGVHGTRAVAIRDPQQTVSKTHALLTWDRDGVHVRDLHATNGIVLLLPGGRTAVPAGGELLVTRSTEMELGRMRVRVEC